MEQSHNDHTRYLNMQFTNPAEKVRALGNISAGVDFETTYGAFPRQLSSVAGGSVSIAGVGDTAEVAITLEANGTLPTPVRMKSATSAAVTDIIAYF